MTSGLDLNAMDPGTPATHDFYRHANGTWLDTTQIPADKAYYASFHELADRVEEQLKTLVDQAIAGENEPGTPRAQVADLYRSFMDEARVEAKGLEPLSADLQAIDTVDDTRGLVELSGRLSRQGVSGLVGFWADNDPGDPERYLIVLGQAGLGLPDESYYRGDEHAEKRVAYVAYVTGLFERLGVEDAPARAQRVMDLETALAGHHWDRVACRDAERTYNLRTAEALAEEAPGLPYDAWRAGLGDPGHALAEVTVRQPSYLTGLGELLTSVDLADWKDWLRVRLLSSAAPYLHADVADHHFAFYGTVLTGQEVQRDRWKRAVSLVEELIPEALSQLYVAEYFPPVAKARMDELVANLVEAFRRSLAGLAWMSEDTRAKALEKLGTFRPKVGYPERWRDYSALHIDATDLLGNVARGSAFETARELGKIGQPMDRDEWFMAAHEVNAYYNPGLNEIVFPAGILQRPFFDAERDDAANYGGIGAVIGHEIGHGFDDQGSKYDAAGALKDWWTEDDRAAFDVLTAAMVEQFDAIPSRDVDGAHLNGALTVGENLGDVAGLAMGLAGYRLAVGDDAPVVDGLTGDQRFFLAWAQVWRVLMRPEMARQLLTVDPHAPGWARANTVVNINAFHEAFGTQPGDPMWRAPEDRVVVF